jgi:hypothetical protein
MSCSIKRANSMNTGNCRNFIKNSLTIPRNFFFYWSGQEFLYVHYLCILSLLNTNKIKRCEVFYETEPSGNKQWDKLKSNPSITFKKLDFKELFALNGFNAEDFRYLLTKGGYNHRSDLFRYLVISCYGGVYLDWDVLVLKDLEPLLKTEFFAGFETYAYYKKAACENINGAVLGSIKRSPAVIRLLEEIRVYLKSSPEFEWSSIGPLLLTSQFYSIKSKIRMVSMWFTEYLLRFRGFDTHLSRLIIALTKKREFSYRLYPKSYFYYYDWKLREKLFEKSTLPETSYCVHLYGKFSSRRLASINENFIRNDDSLFSNIIQNVVFGIKPPRSVTHKGGFRFIALARKIRDDFLNIIKYYQLYRTKQNVQEICHR